MSKKSVNPLELKCRVNQKTTNYRLLGETMRERIIQLDQGSVNTHQALIQIKGITFILSHKGTYVFNAIIKTCHSPLKSEIFY